jgi:hypothetical protein
VVERSFFSSGHHYAEGGLSLFLCGRVIGCWGRVSLDGTYHLSAGSSSDCWRLSFDY